jgi:hypothetical protein
MNFACPGAGVCDDDLMISSSPEDSVVGRQEAGSEVTTVISGDRGHVIGSS